MSSRTYNDPEIGPVRLVKSARARRISVRVHPLKGVTVTVPLPCSFAAGQRVFGQYREWVLKTMERQKPVRECAPAAAVAPEQLNSNCFQVLGLSFPGKPYDFSVQAFTEGSRTAVFRPVPPLAYSFF